MNITILVPPCYDHKQPAERSAGCTRIVYPMINIYELTLAATLRETGRHAIRYRDFVFNKLSIADFTSFLQTDDSDAYAIWTVNLSIDSDLQAINDIRKSHPTTPIVLFGPGATFYTAKCLVDKNIYVVRGEPEATALELFEALSESKAIDSIQGIHPI